MNQREQFEAAVIATKGKKGMLCDLRRGADGEYLSACERSAWWGYQQATSKFLTIPEECPHLIMFDDTDREQLVFSGTGARPAALKAWEQISGSWNAHLFVRIERNSRDDRYPSALSTPLATEAAKAFAKGFNTLESGGGKYRINMQFKSREDAWGAFNVLARLKQLNTPQ